jgi:hypothetical protein
MTEDDLKELMEEPPWWSQSRESTLRPAWLASTGDRPQGSAIPQTSPVPTRHGTLYGYTKQGCRCEFCCLIRAQYDRERSNPT